MAEEALVQHGLHADEPPLAELRGVPRIMGSTEAFDQVMQTIRIKYGEAYAMPL